MWEFISERGDLIAYNALQHANLVLQAVVVATVLAVGIAVVVDRFRFLDPIANT
ncbi:MAG: ABC transporter permease, partial [Actinomycetales bacterium]